jgi:ankyrin repeat protein
VSGHKVDVNHASQNGDIALYSAAEGDHADVVTTLGKELGADIAKASSTFTPLHKAARFGHTDVCRALVTLGADVNGRCSDSETPLFQCAEMGHVDTCK